MGLFNLFRKNKFTTDVSFDPIPSGEHVTIESNTGVITDPTMEEAEEKVRIMLRDDSEFVTLKPKAATDGIRYIQACRCPQGITVQLGVEKTGRIHLVEKIFDENAAMQLFRDFYSGTAKIDRNEFSPVSFYRK